MLGRDIGEEILVKSASVVTAVTAGGSGDATEVDGTSIQRSALGSMYESVKVVVHGVTTLQAAETLSVAANLQDSADGSSWADFGTAVASAVVATGVTTAAGFESTYDFDIRAARDYVRVQFTPSISTADTDTASIGAVMVLGGATEYPAA